MNPKTIPKTVFIHCCKEKKDNDCHEQLYQDINTEYVNYKSIQTALLKTFPKLKGKVTFEKHVYDKYDNYKQQPTYSQGKHIYQKYKSIGYKFQHNAPFSEKYSVLINIPLKKNGVVTMLVHVPGNSNNFIVYIYNTEERWAANTTNFSLFNDLKKRKLIVEGKQIDGLDIISVPKIYKSYLEQKQKAAQQDMMEAPSSGEQVMSHDGLVPEQLPEQQSVSSQPTVFYTKPSTQEKLTTRAGRAEKGWKMPPGYNNN